MGSLKEREKGILKISQRGDLNLKHLREDHTDDHYNSPVHVVLVSLLVNRLSGLFLTFFGLPKNKLFSLREFLVRL